MNPDSVPIGEPWEYRPPVIAGLSGLVLPAPFVLVTWDGSSEKVNWHLSALFWKMTFDGKDLRWRGLLRVVPVWHAVARLWHGFVFEVDGEHEVLTEHRPELGELLERPTGIEPA